MNHICRLTQENLDAYYVTCLKIGIYFRKFVIARFGTVMYCKIKVQPTIDTIYT